MDDYNGTLKDGGFSEVDLSVYYASTAVGLDWTVTCVQGITDKMTMGCSDTLSLGGNIGYTGTLDKDVLPEQDVDFLGGIVVSAVL